MEPKAVTNVSKIKVQAALGCKYRFMVASEQPQAPPTGGTQTPDLSAGRVSFCAVTLTARQART